MKKTVLLLLLLMVVPTVAFAETGEVPFSVEPLLPENQSADVRGYYDLAVEANQKQDLQVRLYNSTTKKIEIEVSASSAATNANGLLIYDGSLKEKGVKYPFSKIADVREKHISLDSGETYTTTIPIKVPKKGFDGEILGGLHFLQKSDDEATDSLTIKNNYAYAIAVRLHEKANHKKLKPELKLKSVTPKLVDERTAIVAQFVNKQPLLMGKMKFKEQVFREKGKKPLFAHQIDNFAIAPQGIFDIPLMFDNKPLEPGKYIYKASFKKGKENYQFEKSFMIDEVQAEKVNNAAIELEQESNWWYYAIAALMFIIGGLIYYVMRLKRKVKE
ncbi:DUF916 and DUF3324 domain-containing protein [Macrococcus brunensis]|uniref:DUF916 and DUF3324 domain-containing protein n=1 Tax=Macrococcus brunensis TaxID=198483 RepID=UPI001EF02A61|nr:DUF916 and DUF3324 domain-containing protein [Macrococcus brunensis]ULG74963.1 DUF916 and DUF3324 domain-containing protein [Macrococcus brunensis]